MKRLSVILAISLIIVLLVPSVPAFAAADSVHIKTFDSVDGFYSDTELNNAQRFVTNYNPGNSSVYPSLSTLYGYLNNYEWDSTKDSYVIFVSRYSDTLIVWEFDTTKAVNPFLVVKESTFNLPQNGNTSYDFFLFFNSVVSDQYVVRYGELSLNAVSPTWNYGESRYVGSTGIKIYDNTQEQLLDANIPCYFNWDIVKNGGSVVTTSSQSFYSADKGSYTNFLSPDLPYVDGEGNIVDPSPDFESNSNHMYFNSCDFGFCEPKGISSYNQFGGAYIYCRYVVDDWVVNHISDYSLQISMETLLDDQRYFRTLNYPLDRDGCLTLPFKNFGLTGADNVTQGFVVVGNSNQTIDTDYFKVNLYSITTEQSKQEWFENAARTYNTVKAIDVNNTYDWDDVQDFYDSNVAKYNKFTINLRAVLVSGSDNSGPVARSFNLVTGSDIATDTSGYDNDNPFVPDDSSEDYTPSLPSENNTTVPSIIVNTGGTWQGTFNGVIGYDPGYTDLKVDVNKDPDGNFTQYLNPLKNQSFGSWFFSFLNDMPGEMKALLIAGTGVGIFFGLYRFIRRG